MMRESFFIYCTFFFALKCALLSQPGMVAQARNPGTWEAQAGGSPQFQGQPGL